MKIKSTGKKNGDVLSQVTLGQRVELGRYSFKRFRVVTSPDGRQRISSVDTGFGTEQCWIPISDIRGFNFYGLLQSVKDDVAGDVANTKEWQE